MEREREREREKEVSECAESKDMKSTNKQYGQHSEDRMVCCTWGVCCSSEFEKGEGEDGDRESENALSSQKNTATHVA
jgi:hypothetical protein